MYRTLARYVESLSRSPRFYVELLYLSHFQHDAVTAPFAKATSFDDPSDLVVAERVLAYCRDDKGFSFHIVRVARALLRGTLRQRDLTTRACRCSSPTWA